jgi:DNA-binding transcriptional LysR family regulator
MEGPLSGAKRREKGDPVMLDAHQMNVFLQAAQSLSFTEAARRLCMTQPSVSQHIRSLEQRFGTRLFERRGRYLKLTESGQALLPLARKMVKLSVHIEETLEELQMEISGQLLIGCCTSAGSYLLPLLLALFHAENPAVLVTCHVTDPLTALEQLKEGRLHLMVSPVQETGATVEFRKLLTDLIYLVVPARHPWAQLGEIEPAQLKEGKFIFHEETSGTRQAVASQLPEVGLSMEQLNGIMILGASESIALSVKEGIGVAFLSRLAAQEFLRREEIAVVKVAGFQPKRQIWLGRHTNFPATRAQTAFWEYALDEENELISKMG